MHSICSPKTSGELKECAVLGKSLSRLSQPTILAILAAANEPLHGYKIVSEAANYPMFGGTKPDAAGFYRTLKQMEEKGLVTAEWDTPENGQAKRMFKLTDEGRQCLHRWIDSLACYRASIDEFRAMAASALDIALPADPVCSHNNPETADTSAR